MQGFPLCLYVFVHEIGEVDSCELFTIQAWVWAQVSLCRICGGQSGTVTNFTPSLLVLPCLCNFTAVPYSFMYCLEVGQWTH